MEKKKTKIEYVCKKTLLERGWTEKIMDELLPFPKLVDNPHYKCSSPMQLWDLKIVKQKERKKKFKENKEKKERRSKAMKEVAERRKKETMKLAESFNIEVERMDIDTLRNETLADKEAWYFVTNQFERAESVYFADEETVRRWELNYIRHNLTKYDEELEELFGQVGKNDAYWEYKDRIMKKIYEVYPELRIKAK